MNPSALMRYLAHMEEIIQRHGWMVQAVFPTVDDPDHPSFQYTVGLHDRGLPELLSIGLPGDVGQMLLNDVVQVIAERSEAGQPWSGQFEHDDWSMPFFLVAADTPKAVVYATGACNRSGGQAEYLQVCWPDANGRFPWEPGASDDFRKMQPVLGTPILPN